MAAQLTYGQNGLVEALYLQVGSGPFQDEAFRAGFLQSIDSDALFGQTYRSYDAGASRSKCGPTVPGAYCPAGAFVNKYDPAGAEATLAAAGYSRNADGLWARDGVVPQIRWAVSSGNLRREKAQEYLIPLLVAAGFDVIADNCDFECIFVDRLPAGDFDVAMFGTVNSVDPRDLTLQFSCDSISAESNNFSGQNFQFWCDPAASEALHQADVTLDPAVRAELVKQAITAMDAANIMVPLFQFPNVSAYRTDRLADVEAQLANHRAFNDFWRWQDVDGDGQIVIGAPDWPSCLNPITDCANASWYQWTIANPVLPGIWETTNEGGFAITDLVTGEPVVELI